MDTVPSWNGCPQQHPPKDTQQLREVKEEAVASQDKTPTPPTPAGGTAGTDSGRDATGFSDASETIVSGGTAAHASAGPGHPGTGRGEETGTGVPDDGAASQEMPRQARADEVPAGDVPAGDVPAGDVPAEPQEFSDEDWDREFRLAAGEEPGEPGRSTAATPAGPGAADDGAPVLDETDPYNSDPDAVDPSTIALPASGRAGTSGADTSGAVSGGAASGRTGAAASDRDATDTESSDANPFPWATAAGSAASAGTASTGTASTGAAAAGPAGATAVGAGPGTSGRKETSGRAASSATAALPVPAAGTGTSTEAEPAPDKAGKGRKAGRGKNAASPAVPVDAAASEELTQAEAQRRAQEREKAAAAKPVLARVVQVMIAVFFPVMLIAAAIRAVATPLFLWVEYHRPGFPADTYGFSTDDRMTYGSYAMDYILNWSGARYLGDLVTPNGEPLYLASEVSHMADVKGVLSVVFIVATVMAVLTLIGCLYLARRSPGGIRRAFFSGALVTLVLGAGLVVLAVLGWETFFTQVHQLFFSQGNWTFRMDDTLIRLFPAQFWMDAGIVIAALTLLVSLVVLIAAWPTKARRERSRLARENARRRYVESLEAL